MCWQVYLKLGNGYTAFIMLLSQALCVSKILMNLKYIEKYKDKIFKKVVKAN